MQYPSQFPFFKLLCYCCFYYKTDFALPLFGHTYKTEGPSFYFDAYAIEVKSVFFFFLLCFSELFFCLNSQDVDFLPSHQVLFLRRGAKKNSSALCCLSFAFFFFFVSSTHTVAVSLLFALLICMQAVVSITVELTFALTVFFFLILGHLPQQ